MRSLRSALLVSLLPPLILVGAAAAAGAYFFMNRRLAEAYDQDLGDVARALVPLIRPGTPEVSLDLTDLADRVLRSDSSDQVYYAVRDAQGQLVAGDIAMPLPPRVVGELPFFWDDRRNGVPVRAVVLEAFVAGQRVQVLAAETTQKRDYAQRDAIVSAAVPSLLLLLAAVVAILRGVERGLAPLDRLRIDLQERSHVDLRPVDPRHVVNELQPLIQELNGVLGRLQSAQHAQTRFIANAAHQLRTPIAGLVTQLDLAREGPDRDMHLASAREGATRLARLARQILSLAAADPTANSNIPAPCDLAQVVKDQADGWLRSARAVELVFELAPAPVVGDAVLVGELASNLVDNATRYGARNVRIVTRVEDSRCLLEVIDDGPGIPAAAREQIFERFFRLDNQSTEGSGLGLAIVREIAQRHGATVEVADGPAGKGTRITVAFTRAK